MTDFDMTVTGHRHRKVYYMGGGGGGGAGGGGKQAKSSGFKPTKQNESASPLQKNSEF